MSTPRVHYPWYKKEDTDAFFALFQNNIANFVIIAISMLGMGFPAEIVFGQVLPGAAVAVMAGNFYYAWSAARLARKENRADVTALSYGISTPVMFVFLFGVLLPEELLSDFSLFRFIAPMPFMEQPPTPPPPDPSMCDGCWIIVWCCP